MTGKDINNLAYTLGGATLALASLAASIYICINPLVSDQVKLAFLTSSFITAGAGAFVSTREIVE